MSDKPKVLMVLNDIAWFWSHRLPLANALLSKGWHLTLATAGAGNNKDLDAMSVAGVDLPEHGCSKNPLFHLQLLLSIRKSIKEMQPNIIHAITLRHAFYTGLVTRVMGYKPVIFTVAGLGSLYTSPKLKMRMMRIALMPLMRFAFGGKGKFIIFQNPDDQQAMVSASIISKDNSTIIRGSGVDLNEFSYADYVPQDNPIILFSSRLVKEKGIYDFIEAARILKAKNLSARFQVAGDIYLKNPNSLTHAEIQKFHDEGIIEWLGQCDDMPSVIASAQMMVLPSYYGEGVPKILLETAAIGRPIITCDAPGCREAVEHEVNGLLVAPQNSEALADAIELLLNDLDKSIEYGLAGRARVKKDFHVEAVVEKTLDVYNNLLKKA